MGLLWKCYPPTRKEVMEMQANRNALREHRFLRGFPVGDSLKEWLARNITNEIVGEVSLALVAAVSLCYLAIRIYQGLQNYAIYTY